MSFIDEDIKSAIFDVEEEESNNDEKDGNIPEEKYDPADYISSAKCVEKGTVPINILEFHHSHSYDCRKLFNLCCIEPNVIIFASGNFINFFDVINGTVWFRRCSTGGGIGHITKNPVYNHFAIGENGINPPIIIYRWPDIEIITILKNGTKRSYSHLCYNSDGTLLASQGGHPDFMITIWNWSQSRILLQAKSHISDVYNITFNWKVHGHIVTSGQEHIKFWKIPITFTGLKLKGEVGKFGSTPISDIIGHYAMPDEKVISGTEWGNIILWENNLIKVEFCRQNDISCHSGAITYFEQLKGELLSVGMDGWIHIWNYDSIDSANPGLDEKFIHARPVAEFYISEDTDKDIANKESSMLMYIQKKNNAPDDTHWYGQDGNGGIWLIDLSTFKKPEAPKKILNCHAGAILDMAVADWGPYVSTIGSEGQLQIRNYLRCKLIVRHKFRESGCRLVWLPCEIDPSGCSLICGFATGVIRHVSVHIPLANEANNHDANYVKLLHIFKPHNQPITAMALNESKNLLITCSEDSTVFAFSIFQNTDCRPEILPIGFIRVPSAVTCLTWKPYEESTLLVGCLEGDFVENTFPTKLQDYTKESYELIECVPKIFKFHSVKSAIRREIKRLEYEKLREERVAKKRERLAQLILENPGIGIDEEAFLADNEPDPPLPELHIPNIPNKILALFYTTCETIGLFMSGFDAGYLYEYPNPDLNMPAFTTPVHSTMIADADDTEVTNIFVYDDRFMFLGMQYGEIRVCRMKPDCSDLSDYWILPVHDNHRGYVTKILLSYDHKVLLTSGQDGNLFSFYFNDDKLFPDIKERETSSPVLFSEEVDDIRDPFHPTIEDVIVKLTHDKLAAIEKEKRDHILQKLEKLSEEYESIMKRNEDLPESQRIPRNEFELDPRITKDLNKELEAEKELIKAKWAYEVEKSTLSLKKLTDYFVEPITCLPFAVKKILKPESMVRSLRENKLGDDFFRNYEKVTKMMKSSEVEKKYTTKKTQEFEQDELEVEETQEMEDVFKDIGEEAAEHRLGSRLNRMLQRYREHKEKLAKLAKEMREMNKVEPDVSRIHPEDEKAIEDAKSTIGDYKLKTLTSYHALKEDRETVVTKYKQLLDCKRALHNLRENFNTKLRAVRTKKEALRIEVLNSIKILERIHAELPRKRIKSLPIVPIIDMDVEFPERNLEVERYSSKKDADEIKIDDHLTPDWFDEEYEVLLLDEKQLQTGWISFADEKPKIEIRVSTELIKSLDSSDNVETNWEREMKRRRTERKVHEQDCILAKIDENYKSLDEELDGLERERLHVVVESVYKELYLLTLQQELIILKNYEQVENRLRDKVTVKRDEQETIKHNMQMVNSYIESGNKKIKKLQDKIKFIASEYGTMISENKFHNFLWRIFRKKFKTPKTDKDSSSSCSSSESSSDDSGRSVDSREIELMHMDENICPSGCDKDLHSMAFMKREERYNCESQIRDEQKLIEAFNKDLELNAKQLKFVIEDLKSVEQEFEIYILEKQEKLNDINMTVILKFHQLQHFDDENKPTKIKDCIVFDKKRLGQLYSRIEELKKETIEQKEKHKKNKEHLTRMNIDIKFMEKEQKRLREEIKEEIIKKFGREMSITTLYEAVLRKIIYEIKSDMKQTMKIFDKQIKCINKKYHEETEILKNLVRENTEKMSFLTVLEEEQYKLKKILNQEFVSEEKFQELEIKYSKDLNRIERILQYQTKQKKLLRTNIKNLSMKSRPLPPISSMKRISETFISSEVSEDGKETKLEESSSMKPNIFNDVFMEASTSYQCYNKEDIPSFEKGDSREISELNFQKLLKKNLIDVSLDSESREELTQIVLTEIMTNWPTSDDSENIYTIIEKSLDNVQSNFSEWDESKMSMIHDVIRGELDEIISKSTIGITSEISVASIERKISDIFNFVEVDASTKQQHEFYELLRSSGADVATNFLVGRISTSITDSMLEEVKGYINKALTEVLVDIDNLAVMSVSEIDEKKNLRSKE